MAGEWQTLTIKDIAEKVAMGPFGSSIKVETFMPEGVPIISGQHLHGSRVDDAPGFKFISHEHAQRLANANVMRGDIVFTHAGNIGQAAYIPEDSKFERYVISQRQFYMRCDRSKAIPEFVTLYFRSPEGRHQLLANRSQVGVPSIAQPVTYLRTIEIPVPPLPEQRVIADVLGALDDKIEQNRQTAGKLERLAQAIFRAWFVDFEPVKAKAVGADSFPSMPQHVFDALPTRFVDSEIGPVPEGWEVKALSTICTLVSGGTPKRSDPSYWSGDVPWYSVKDAPREGETWVINTDETITQDGLAESAARLVPKGCTIISARGTVGKLAMAGMPMAFNQSCYGLWPSDGISFRHLYLLVHTAVAALQQKTHGSVFDTITRTTFDGLIVISPPPNVLSAFEERVAPFFDASFASLQESVKLAELRDYVLPKLLSGQIRVEVAVG